MYVVFVESNSKCKKIEDILNKNLKEEYKVFATGGHIRELPTKELAVDVDKKYKARYVYNKRSTMMLKKKLKYLMVEKIFLATDPDIEGERIAYDVYEYLKKEFKVPFLRVRFNEITKDAVLHGFSRAGEIDMNIVNAQSCRRVMDRLIGYKVTPYLWKNIDSKASAGRVLSVVARMLYDREKAVENHVYDTKIVLEGHFGRADEKLKTIGDSHLDNEELRDATYFIKDVLVKRVMEAPSAPYTTATIQRDALTKLGLSAKMCMKVLQNLYQDGYITYIRTDSTKLSNSFRKTLFNFVRQQYSPDMVKKRENKGASKHEQGAHEAIRPTNLGLNANILSAEAFRLYSLIWKRTVAWYLIEAEREVQDVVIQDADERVTFNGSVSRLAFPGWRSIFGETETLFYDFRKKLGKEIDYSSIDVVEKYNAPPGRFKEHTLIRDIEKKGLGRPSTYAYFMDAIQYKKFAEKKNNILNAKKVQHITKIKRSGIQDIVQNIEFREHNVLVLSGLGEMVVEYLNKNFETIMDYDYTANLETEIDNISMGKRKYEEVVDVLYQQLKKHL